MATDVQEKLQAFEFNHDTVQPGDVFRLDHEGGQVVIVVTDVNGRDVCGIATNSKGDWCGPWGRIIFYAPIKVDKKTVASFNQTGGYVSQLEVVATKLVREREGHYTHLLG